MSCLNIEETKKKYIISVFKAFDCEYLNLMCQA